MYHVLGPGNEANGKIKGLLGAGDDVAPMGGALSRNRNSNTPVIHLIELDLLLATTIAPGSLFTRRKNEIRC
jgi:hypothetical protein